MKLIALLELAEGVDPSQLAPFRESEAQKVWELYRSGVVRAAHYRTDRFAAVLELESPTLSCAEQELKTLPAVSHGLVEIADLIPTAPYVGFEAMFNQKGVSQ
jgi:hypothetical protein